MQNFYEYIKELAARPNSNKKSIANALSKANIEYGLDYTDVDKILNLVHQLDLDTESSYNVIENLLHVINNNNDKTLFKRLMEEKTNQIIEKLKKYCHSYIHDQNRNLLQIWADSDQKSEFYNFLVDELKDNLINVNVGYNTSKNTTNRLIKFALEELPIDSLKQHLIYFEDDIMLSIVRQRPGLLDESEQLNQDKLIAAVTDVLKNLSPASSGSQTENNYANSGQFFKSKKPPTQNDYAAFYLNLLKKFNDEPRVRLIIVTCFLKYEIAALKPLQEKARHAAFPDCDNSNALLKQNIILGYVHAQIANELILILRDPLDNLNEDEMVDILKQMPQSYIPKS
jgi:hypothetical protein